MTVLRVEHLTAYAYADRVELAWHMVHLRPRQLPWQTVRQFRLITEPVPDTVHWGTDAFGNPVAWLFMTHAHSSLDVTTEAVVEVTARPIPTVAATPAWEDVAAAALQPESAREVAEFSLGSPMAPALAEAAAYVGESFAPGRPILEGLIEVTSRIHRDFRFDAAATTVSTPVARVLQLRAGGVPGFRASDDRGAAGAGAAGAVCVGLSADAAAAGAGADAGADASHAWVSCWLGPVHGWIDLDPTNDLVVQDGHVWIGWGRDYADVSPIRGMLLGGGRHSLKVSVDIEPEEEAAASGLGCSAPSSSGFVAGRFTGAGLLVLSRRV